MFVTHLTVGRKSVLSWKSNPFMGTQLHGRQYLLDGEERRAGDHVRNQGELELGLGGGTRSPLFIQESPEEASPTDRAVPSRVTTRSKVPYSRISVVKISNFN